MRYFTLKIVLAFVRVLEHNTAMDSRLARIELEEQIMKTTIYYVTANSWTADAYAIVDRVNTVTANNGDSLSQKAVQTEMNEILNKIAAHGHMTAEEIRDLYGLKVVADEIEVE